MSGGPFGDRQPAKLDRSMNVRLSGFAWEAIEQEAAKQGVSVEELVTFALMYYLADADSGRIARQVSRGPYASASSPDGDDSDAEPTDPASPDPSL